MQTLLDALRLLLRVDADPEVPVLADLVVDDPTSLLHLRHDVLENL